MEKVVALRELASFSASCSTCISMGELCGNCLSLLVEAIATAHLDSCQYVIGCSRHHGMITLEAKESSVQQKPSHLQPASHADHTPQRSARQSSASYTKKSGSVCHIKVRIKSDSMLWLYLYASPSLLHQGQ
jgi:hypothetical protein